MSLSSIELWQRIAAEGLASPMLCRSWAAESAKSLNAANAADGIHVLKHLVELGKLTKYQAKILAGQSSKPLKRGDFHILGPVKSGVFAGWLEVTKIDTAQADWPPPTWATWIQADEIRKLQPCGPSLTRGIQLSNINSPFVQTVHMPEKVGNELLLQVEPVRDGIPLDDFLSKTERKDSVTQAIFEIASGLAALHESGITHGRLLPDRVFTIDGQAVLVVDPLAQEAGAIQAIDMDAPGALTSRLGDLHPASFLAPEFLAPGQTSTPVSDVYALGCLWAWMLGGKSLFAGATAQEILSKTASQPPKLDDLSLPAPLKKVLSFALSKNPSNRFADATEFLSAFEIAIGIVKDGKQPPVPVAADSSSINTKETETAESSSPAKPIPVASGKKVPPSGAGSQIARPANKEPQEQIAKPNPTQVLARPVKAAAVSAGNQLSEKKSQGSIPTKKTKPSKTADSKSVAKGKAGESPSTPDPKEHSTAPQEHAQQPAPEQPSVGKRAAKEAELTAPKPQGPTSSRKVPSRRKKSKKKNKFIVPVAGGCGFLVLLLVLLKVSGALDPRAEKEKPKLKIDLSNIPNNTPVERDARQDLYRIVSGSGQELWLPPEKPSPIAIQLLPPGGQVFVSWRPAAWLSDSDKKQLLSTFDAEVGPLLESANSLVAIPAEQIEHMVIAFYRPVIDGGIPQFAARVQLANPLSLADLKNRLQAQNDLPVGTQTLIELPSDRAIFVAEQPLVTSQSVKTFSIGPKDLMREVAELEGAAGALTSPMEKLLQASDKNADLAILAAPPFLFATGRYILEQAPERFRKSAGALFGTDTRAILIQSRLDELWYTELQAIGPSDRDAARIGEQLRSKISGLANATESYFVEQTPHPHWRALAFRFPQMLRTLAEYTRVGVEDGVAILNFYMPSNAAENLLLASWINMQEAATISGSSGGIDSPAVQPLSIEQYLARKISVSFAQEPIENALQAIADEANDQLPTGTPALRFLLDGDAFEDDGITRNQQLSDFAMNNQPVRQVLTEVAKLGNPVPGITDFTIDDQKLIWVVADDPQNPGKKMISLTTRKAAIAGSISLPPEFSP